MFAQKKIYLSLSQSRQLASEYPIGDPFGGPAYGQRELFGLIAGALAIFEGVTAISAVGFTIAAGAAIVGGALTVIGTLTGDANLTQIGGIIGLGGAAISLATGGWEAMSSQFSSWFGDGAALSSEAVKGLSDFGVGTAATANSGFTNVPDFTSNATGGIMQSSVDAASISPIATGGDGVLGDITAQWSKAAGETNYAAQAANPFGVEIPGGSTTTPIAPDPTVTQAAQQSSAAGTIGTNDAVNASGNAGQGLNAGNVKGVDVFGRATGGTNTAGIGAGTESSTSGVTKFFKENSELIKMVGQGTASLFERLSPSEKTKAETLAQKAAAGATDARAELDRWTLTLKQQQANNANTVVPPGLLASSTAGNVTRSNPNAYMPRSTYMPA